MENRRITIREVAEDVGISVGSCHAIFSDILGLKAQEMLNDVNDDPDLLKKVITHVKFGQMSRFCSLFSLIIMA